MKNELAKVFEKDLKKLKEEIESYEESDLFKTATGITNSAGNLAMHLVGNLKHFIGAVLGNSGYIRNREFEFAGQISQAALLTEIEETQIIVRETLAKITAQNLDQNYPVRVFGDDMTSGFFLIHLLGHLNYHMGQINYHRRLIKNF